MSATLMDQATGLNKDQAAMLEHLQELQHSAGGVKSNANTPSPRYFGSIPSTGRIPNEADMWGFKSMAHFVHDVEMHSREGSLGTMTKSYEEAAIKSFNIPYIKAPSGQNESLLSEGAALVPPEFARQILERAHMGVDLMSMSDAYTVSGNTLKFPTLKEDSRADSSRHGGLLGAWDNEADQIATTKIKLRQIQLNLKRLTILAFTTQELRQDSSNALEQFLIRKAGDEVRFKVGDAMTNGDGDDRPLGYLKSPARVTVDALNGAADTIKYQNVLDMYARMPVGSMQRAVWLANQDTLPQLWAMYLATGTSGHPVLLPPNGAAGQPYMTLMGRPIILTEWCPTLGTEGDLSFVDLNEYITISKGTIDTAMSIHLRFDYAEEAFRFIFRMDGMPWNQAPLTPFKGTATQSPIVTLNSTRTGS